MLDKVGVPDGMAQQFLKRGGHGGLRFPVHLQKRTAVVRGDVIGFAATPRARRHTTTRLADC